VPKPHLVKDCAIDLRVGGRFNTVFSVKGAEMKNKGVRLEIVPDEKLVFTDFYTEGRAPSVDPFMTAIILFQDAPSGDTRYTATIRRTRASRMRIRAFSTAERLSQTSVLPTPDRWGAEGWDRLPRDQLDDVQAGGVWPVTTSRACPVSPYRDFQIANPFDMALQHVTALDRAHTSGRAGHDDIAGFQLEILRQHGNHFR